MHSKRMYSFKTIGPNCYIDIRHKTYIDRILSIVLWNIKKLFFTNWSVCVCVLRPVGYKSSSCCDVRNLFFIQSTYAKVQLTVINYLKGNGGSAWIAKKKVHTERVKIQKEKNKSTISYIPRLGLWIVLLFVLKFKKEVLN